jgi:hypothetical protein
MARKFPAVVIRADDVEMVREVRLAVDSARGGFDAAPEEFPPRGPSQND